MASRLTALSDLKTAFADFDAMSTLVDGMRRRADEINKLNKTAAGDDEIGKRYHKSVDTGTTNLTSLLKTVRESLDRAGVAGQNASDRFTKADQEAADLARGGKSG
ncbi:hypothetical protein [Streptomyces sp. WAC06614]|uniref:hypothetical protein n=1 Tax=Streptomyces sp. WAC06614 TaxID=2487416 RepID=UPI000F769C26|nr:hypothetical protein [Streptomyces sp. WAC06614]RSS83743.1 hypothetical protein EF918_02760 [Streptomyces sp. WAC06614]